MTRVLPLVAVLLALLVSIPVAASAQPVCTSITVSRSPTKPEAAAGFFDRSGGTAFIYVTASTPDCTWTASTSTAWITFPNGTAGVGSAWFEYAVAPTSTSRDGAFAIVANASRMVNVSQIAGTFDGPGLMQSPVGWTASPSTAAVAQPFRISGFAIDDRATTGPGISGIDVYYVDHTGYNFLGTATYGLPHQHIADRLGSEFLNSGFEMLLTGIPTIGTTPTPGGVSVQAFGRSTVDGSTLASAATRVSVKEPTLDLAPASLQFGAATGAGPALVTPGQSITISGFAWTTGWTAAGTAPWIRISATSGTGPGSLIVSIDPAAVPAAGTLSGSVRISIGAIPGGQLDVPVRVDAYPSATTAAPFGVFEPPPSPTTGAVPITGWALDDVAVSAVAIYRNRTATEGGPGLVFIGTGTFTDGARPDVAAAFPAAPQKTRAGWGYMLLSNVLPDGGNGTFTFHAYAIDVESRQTFLGSRDITIANATSEEPFGALDLPAPGETVAGLYTFTGWALSPRPGRITRVDIVLDGQRIGLAQYGLPRPDVAALFGGPSGPVDAAAAGFKFTIDTRGLANGLHTIAFVAANNAAGFAGLGSRFFTVKNP